MRLIVPSDKVNHRDITLLAIPMTASNTLFYALRVPWQIVVNNSLTKLEVQPLCASLGAYENF